MRRVKNTLVEILFSFQIKFLDQEQERRRGGESFTYSFCIFAVMSERNLWEKYIAVVKVTVIN